MLTEKQKEILNFEYQKIPLVGRSHSTASADLNIISSGDIVDPELVAVYKPSDKKILGVINQNQYLISHLEAHERVEAAITKAGLEAEVTQHRVLRNGARVFTHYRLPTYKLDIENPQLGTADPKEPDTVVPEIIARNGYDGDIMFGLEWGLFRTVCSNGARVTIIGKRNTPKNLMGDVDVDVIVGHVTEFVELVQRDIFARIQEMVNTKSEELPINIRAWFSNLVSNKLVGCYDEKLKEELTRNNQLISEWTLFNIITGLITHEVTSYNRQRSLEQAAAKRFRFGAAVR